MITYQPDRGLLIVGDYLSNVEFPFVYHSVSDYRRTLTTLEEILTQGGVRLLISGHGDPTDDRREMQRRIDDSRRYLDDLEHSVRGDRPFDLPGLYRRYGFPTVMEAFHRGNEKIMRPCHLNHRSRSLHLRPRPPLPPYSTTR